MPPSVAAPRLVLMDALHGDLTSLRACAQYHKLCLKCVQCNRLLEPRLLVDHDGQAYCNACHAKSYGTKGYGAGGALVGEYAPRPPSPTKSSTPASPAPPPRPVSAAAPPPPAPALPNRPVFSPAPPSPSAAPVAAAPPASPAQAPAAPAPAARALPPRPVPPPKPSSVQSTLSPASPSAVPPAPRPLSPTPERSSSSDDTPSGKPAPPPFDEDDQRGPLSSLSLSSAPTLPLNLVSGPSIARKPPVGSRPPAAASPAPSYTSLASLCPRCSKQVYHAERVQALSRAWHRACLRCTACGTGMGAAPGRVEERDGEPYCQRCYRERWGITGGMGLATRPNLY
ncbi:hypothetical protein Rhopal_006789-T1 [Rhodotorula paludigena]|uniref:LIM zinc-binding domain-containing protein n=1 Tax=Rhodotorula paludigena TaxID=86838 RepID=A0AAV5GWM4_9BASI|nr:hypothetical protein Rhopal_006789-T1 [Rhodotorula paludigena]